METIEFKHFQDVNWHVENTYENFAWFYKQNGKEDERFRIDVRIDDSEKKTIRCDILSLSSSKKFQKECMEVVHRIFATVPKETNIIVTKSTPSKEAWSTSTAFIYMSIPILLFNIFLYFLTLNFVPKGEMISVLFLIFSIPSGYILSSVHHWGAGAPFAGFEKMIRAMRWKYALLNFCCSLFTLVIISISISWFR